MDDGFFGPCVSCGTRYYDLLGNILPIDNAADLCPDCARGRKPVEEPSQHCQAVRGMLSYELRRCAERVYNTRLGGSHVAAAYAFADAIAAAVSLDVIERALARAADQPMPQQNEMMAIDPPDHPSTEVGNAPGNSRGWPS